MIDADGWPSNEYGRYCVPAGLESRPAAKAVLAGGVYEPDTIRFMRAHAGDGDIIHAGTFFGDFLPALSAALAPGCTVWAFEPNPGSHDCAARTIALNGLPNVMLTHAALSDRPGTVLFRTTDDRGQPLGGLSQIVDAPGIGVQQVPAAMIDYVVPLQRRVSILQLDVEGHERAALRGAFHIVRQARPILILENMNAEKWVQRLFRGMGYAHRGKLHGNHVYACTEVAL